MDEGPKRAPDYTTAFLVTTGGILLMGFFTLAAIAGTIAVALGVAAVDLVIRFLDWRRSAARAVTPPRDEAG
ncbi:hypothetical protein [Histidinibacterium lentulum]|uniref:Uncharacterized protein n=1 Tax=Histidinibacterium lentulum TaxID=2480588 RepID=A0A3N2R7B1_9RHOB|nr:hypothetical protein [Histidinibacterium lentulum]ROU03317.1 hypothetical protein EAT49_03145 [Histidinibacterium lentulum]